MNTILKLIVILSVSVFSQTASELYNNFKLHKNDSTIAINTAKQLHDLAVEKGNSEYTKYAKESLKILLDENPTHVIAMAYLGSVHTLIGRDAYNPINKIKEVERGCDLMDKAIEMDPNNITIRIIRSQNNLQLPDFFNRLPYVGNDLKFLLSDSIFSQMSNTTQVLILYSKGIYYEKSKKLAKAIEAYQSIMKYDESTPLYNKAKNKIDEFTK
jgi:tetratricopeptide (TPR) repeat protein